MVLLAPHYPRLLLGLHVELSIKSCEVQFASVLHACTPIGIAFVDRQGMWEHLAK